MAEVKSFPGVSLPDQAVGAQPSPEVVEFIEKLLDEAKRGEIQGIAVAYVRPDNVTGDGFADSGTSAHALFAAVNDLQYSCARERFERGCYVPFKGNNDVP